MAMLEISDLHTYYGNIHALKGISLTVEQGEVVTLIGSNGAGKSTTLRTISGLNQARSGEINFNGQSMRGIPAHRVAMMGIAQSPEGRRVFPRMSVLENLEMGAFVRGTVDQSDIARVLELFPRLKERIDQKAGTMSGGEQQMLAIGRALMARPNLLLLDEPSMGLSPLYVDRVYEAITALKAKGVTILMVEQSANRALEIADRAYVLRSGHVVVRGKASALAGDPAIRRAYLGERAID